MLRITPEEAYARWKSGEPIVFIDARNPKAWESSDVKLPGAIRILPDQVDPHANELLRGRPIFVYCT